MFEMIQLVNPDRRVYTPPSPHGFGPKLVKPTKCHLPSLLDLTTNGPPESPLIYHLFKKIF